METTYCCPLLDEWIKMITTYIHTIEYHSAMRKKEILPSATTWMDFEGILLSEISRERQISILYGVTHVEFFKKSNS